jgi:NADPH-dependent curcumin reductase CurA
LGGYYRFGKAEATPTGKLKNKETVVVGIDQAVSAFLGLFTGKNIGKMVVKFE